MTPGTVLLLGSAAGWSDVSSAGSGALSDELERLGISVLDVELPPASPAQVRLTAVMIAVRTARPAQPVALLAVAEAGELLPAVGRALASTGSRVGGYLFVDATLPGRTDDAPLDQLQIGDWPDAPCGYLRTSSDRAAESRTARLRGWSVVDLTAGAAAAVAEGGTVQLAPSIATLLDLL